MVVCKRARMFLTENQMFYLRDHMKDTSQSASSIGPGPGKGSTHSRGRSTSAPELSSSVALVPVSLKRRWDLIGADRAHMTEV